MDHPRRSTKEREKRPSRRSASTSSDDDSESDDNGVPHHVQCWIPSANIDLIVLATYLREFIDPAAQIQARAKHTDPTKQGFLITARNTLSVAGVRDIIDDSRDWKEETKSRSYRREPYGFGESDAWTDRKKKGASPGSITRRGRRQQNTTATDAGKATTDPKSQSQIPRSQALDRHAARGDPNPEPRPQPQHPPPDAASYRTNTESIDARMANVTLADYNTKKSTTYGETRETTNRPQVHPNMGTTRQHSNQTNQGNKDDEDNGTEHR